MMDVTNVSEKNFTYQDREKTEEYHLSKEIKYKLEEMYRLIADINYKANELSEIFFGKNNEIEGIKEQPENTFRNAIEEDYNFAIERLHRIQNFINRL